MEKDKKDRKVEANKMSSEIWGQWVTEETIMVMFILFIGCWFFFVFIEPYVRSLYEERKVKQK